MKAAALAATLATCISAACADAAMSTVDGGSVRLRAVELAPEDPMPGGTFVLVENRGKGSVGLGCWRIRTNRAVLAIRAPAVLPAGAALRLFFDRGTVGNPDRIRLISRAGRLIDSTPALHDTKGDDRLFARTDDGWALGRAPFPARIIEGRLARLGSSGC
jgi:hypothetical protein